MDDEKYFTYAFTVLCTVALTGIIAACVQRVAGFQAQSDRYRACVAYHMPERCGPLPGVSP